LYGHIGFASEKSAEDIKNRLPAREAQEAGNGSGAIKKTEQNLLKQD
jgi:hypothetical protein